MPFSELPAKPRKPHAFHRMSARDVEVPSADLGTVRAHVRELGSGPRLLLVHGLMTTSYSWRYVVAPLSERFRVVVPDLPGAGRSARPVGVKYSAPALGRWIGELVHALDIRGCAAVGNSLGGYLCLWTLLELPDTFRGLVNVHSPAVVRSRLRALHVALSLPGARAALRRMVQRDVRRWAHRNVHYYDESLKSVEEAEEYGGPLATEKGLDAFYHYLKDSLAPADLSAFARRLRKEGTGTTPVLHVYAREDPMVPPADGKRLAKLMPGSRLEWLDESSHFAHVDTPDRVVALVRDFFEDG